MQLDDNCVVDRKGLARLRFYRTSYGERAAKMGVRLASEYNPSKVFPPSGSGEILGLLYNGEQWIWRMSSDKSDRLLVLVGKGIRQGKLLKEEAMTFAGKINQRRWSMQEGLGRHTS